VKYIGIPDEENQLQLPDAPLILGRRMISSLSGFCKEIGEYTYKLIYYKSIFQTTSCGQIGEFQKSTQP
jgi:hypothetical protein